ERARGGWRREAAPGGGSFFFLVQSAYAERQTPPTPDPSPPRASRAAGGEPRARSMISRFARRLATALTTLTIGGTPATAQTLRIAPHSDLKVVDPIWTSALISVNHGYMIYDTLFALDDELAVQPQMVDRYETSADKLTWTFTLRDGLAWHDGQPVTAE